MQFNAKLLKRKINLKDLVPCGGGAQQKNNHYGIETIETLGTHKENNATLLNNITISKGGHTSKKRLKKM
jgi:hypothetical protein